MYCRKPNGVLVDFNQPKYRRCSNGRLNQDGTTSAKCGGWKFFLANCPKGNMMCSGMSGAWVPAVTVCVQQLF